MYERENMHACGRVAGEEDIISRDAGSLVHKNLTPSTEPRKRLQGRLKLYGSHYVCSRGTTANLVIIWLYFSAASFARDREQVRKRESEREKSLTTSKASELPTFKP